MDNLQQLLESLKSEDPEVRKKATVALWVRWYEEAGQEAGNRMQEGIHFLNASQLDEAEDVFARLVADYPEFSEGHNKLATVLFLKGEYQLSIEQCQTTIKLNPHHFGAWNGLGMCQYQMGRFHEAIVSFQKALEIQPYAKSNRMYIAKCRGKLN